MRIVLDTNVVVSGLLTPFGAPAQIVRMVASGHLVLCYDARVLTEYEDVLRRPKFDFPDAAVSAVLDQIEEEGFSFATTPLRTPLPDRDDEPFLEVAVAANIETPDDPVPLVTGNSKHYPEENRQGVKVVTPRFFIDQYRKSAEE
ncbi:MAG: putative toxin-antitoxin system toxin component, PIN family [Acidobacteriota bacterium]|nr:MAG: putative toxin-antitoxin system toxin component, PIN family [Acidobacteriota bacterium]